MSHNESRGIVSVEFSTIVHATEDAGRVMEAVLNIIPSELRGSISFTRRYLEGHHRNPIVMLTARVAKKEMAKAIVKHLFTMLSRSERRELNLDLERSLDEENNFYTRLDKQEAVNGRVRLTREDPIRVKVRTNTWRPTVEDIRKIFMDLGMIE